MLTVARIAEGDGVEPWDVDLAQGVVSSVKFTAGVGMVA